MRNYSATTIRVKPTPRSEICIEMAQNTFDGRRHENSSMSGVPQPIIIHRSVDITYYVRERYFDGESFQAQDEIHSINKHEEKHFAQNFALPFQNDGPPTGLTSNVNAFKAELTKRYTSGVKLFAQCGFSLLHSVGVNAVRICFYHIHTQTVYLMAGKVHEPANRLMVART